MSETLVLLADASVFPFVLGVLGLIVGSFLNVVIHRLPRMMEAEWHKACAEWQGTPRQETETLTLSRPRSRCPHCGHAITALENIPVVSYLCLRGKCRGCHAPISPRYPLVEITAALLAVGCALGFPPILPALAATVLCWALLVLALIDFDTQLLPDQITLPLLWLGLLFNLAGGFVPLSSAVLGAVAGYLFLWSVYWLFRLATGKEGMGFGDFKLLAALGAWLGWKLLPLIILISSVLGALTGMALIFFARRGREVPMPFGPFLAGAGLIALFFGAEMNRAWLGFLG
ncbi:MAG: A24 family peptidase [Zoogloeaceae bacterium]|jgi:leader peptidase (prepilin peptidase)/N-methyltransferase|nr:A24 family peptidase [Zoogloeaceae bacterium]